MKIVSFLEILITKITRVHSVGHHYQPLLYCKAGRQTVSSFNLANSNNNNNNINNTNNHYINMKRSSTGGGLPANNAKKQKQSSLFDSIGGSAASTSSKADLEGKWKDFGEVEKGLKPLLYFTPNIMKGLALLVVYLLKLIILGYL